MKSVVLINLIFLLHSTTAQDEQQCCQVASSIIQEFNRLHLELADQKSLSLETQIFQVREAVQVVAQHMQGSMTAWTSQMESSLEQRLMNMRNLSERYETQYSALEQTLTSLNGAVEERMLSLAKEMNETMEGITRRVADNIDYTIGNAALRLVGDTSNRGRLEVFRFGQWGTVCDDGFSNADAALFCRAMKNPYANAEAIEEFEGGSGLILLDNVDCDGQQDAKSCRHQGWGVHNCGHHEDVGLDCR